MSVVYVAYDKVLNREVAIKRLKVSTQNERTWLRFQQEAMACAALRHPNIVSIFDFGADSKGVPYIVLDYLRGQTLAQHLVKKRFLSFVEMFDIILPLLDGLEHAHKSGVVHRDIKPANVFLQRIDASEKMAVKIMDFGIAKVISDRESGFETRTGEVIGSPFYISPEQLADTPVDHRADLYSLGCMMFEMITGKPPFTGNSVLQTFIMHKTQAPPLLCEQLKDRPCNKKLEAILDKLLKKQPDSRFQSVSELKEALQSAQEDWLSDESIVKLDMEQIQKAGSTANFGFLNELFDTFQQTGNLFESKRNILVALSILVLAAGTCAIVYVPMDFEKSAAGTTTRFDEINLGAGGALQRMSVDQLRAAVSRRKDGGTKLELLAISNLDQLVSHIAWEHRQLDTITFSNMPVTATSIAKLEKMPNLRHMFLDEVKGVDAQLISAIISIKSLNELALRNCQLSSDALSPLRGRRLEALTIYAPLTERQIKDIAAIKDLRRLNIDEVRMERAWLRHLSNMTSLDYLYLWSEMNGQDLAFLDTMNIREVVLRGPTMQVSDLQKLKPILSVTQLDIEKCVDLNDEAFREFCRIFPNVATLDLKSPNITDDGFRALKNLKNLFSLDAIGCTAISDQSIPLFESLPKLKEVRFVDTNISSKGLIRLMRRRHGIFLRVRTSDAEFEELKKVARDTGCKIEDAEVSVNDVEELNMSSQ